MNNFKSISLSLLVIITIVLTFAISGYFMLRLFNARQGMPSLDAQCLLTEVQLANGRVVKGRRQLFGDEKIEVGIVSMSSSNARILLPDSVGFFMRDRATGKVISQGMSSDEIMLFFPSASFEEIKRITNQQTESL